MIYSVSVGMLMAGRSMCFGRPPEDAGTGTMAERVSRFLSDRSAETLLGKRRVSRDETVEAFAETAASLGYSVSVYPDVSGTDVIAFRDWVGNSNSMRDLRRAMPRVDIVFGQDLCHQVPAVVRYRE